MAPEPEFRNGRRLDTEFSNSRAYFRQLTATVIEALTHPSETVREKRKRELQRTEIVYSTLSGALQLKRWNNVTAASVRRYHICEQRIISAGIVGNGVYVGLADAEGRESVAYLCDINTRGLTMEGITMHPFKLSQEHQELQDPRL